MPYSIALPINGMVYLTIGGSFSRTDLFVKVLKKTMTSSDKAMMRCSIKNSLSSRYQSKIIAGRSQKISVQGMDLDGVHASRSRREAKRKVLDKI